MSGPWEKYKKAEGAAPSAPAAPTEKERLDSDIAALQREIKRAQEDKTGDPEARARQISILEGELARAVNRQNPIGQAAEPPNPFDFDFSKFKADQTSKKPAFGMNATQDILAGAAGAATGMATAAPEMGRSVIRNIGKSFGEGMKAGVGALPTSSAPPVPTYGGEKWVKSLTDVNLPGGQMGKADLDLAKGMQSSIRGPAAEPGFTGGKITPGGVIVGPQTAAQLPEAAPAPTQKQPGALSRATGAVLGNPVVQRGLGGFGVGAGTAEAIERARKGDIPGTALAGTAALGSAASMFPPTAVPGSVVSGTATGALSLVDKIRNKLASEAQNPPIPEPTPEDMVRANRPALMYRPSIRRPQPSKAEAISGALLQSLDEQLKEFSSASG